MATKKESAAQAVENAVETVEKVEAATEEKDDGMVTILQRAANKNSEMQPAVDELKKLWKESS